MAPSDDDEFVWYFEAIFLMRSLKANSFRLGIGSLKIGTICSSCTDPVSPSDSTDFDDDPELRRLVDPGDFLVLRLFFFVFSSNKDGPVNVYFSYQNTFNSY